jgi:hypothetical protein
MLTYAEVSLLLRCLHDHYLCPRTVAALYMCPLVRCVGADAQRGGPARRCICYFLRYIYVRGLVQRYIYSANALTRSEGGDADRLQMLARLQEQALVHARAVPRRMLTYADVC